MRRVGFLTKAVMLILIVVLSATLFYTMYSYSAEQKARTQSLRDDAIKQEESEKEEEEAERIAAEEEAAAKIPVSISCRGESWASDGNNREDGWPALLGIIMEENNVNAVVSDYTWDMSGSLSQMRFADVPEETVNEFIDRHNKNGLQNVRVETVVRDDLEENYIERNDYDSIPVICIGYSGGYGRSSDELIEQQSVILNTYNLQEPATNADENSSEETKYNDGEMGISGKYLILGHLPSDWTDLENYENRMRNAWGDHFVSLNDIEGDVLSWEFREDVAETVYDKLVEMKYLEK